MLKSTVQKLTAVVLLLALVASSSHSWAQQEKMFSQYMFNMNALNPAYTGSRDILSATGLYRNQWSSIEGAPKTMTFTLDSPVKGERLGVGVQAFNDQLGLENHTGIYLSGSFRIRLTERTTLALGAQAGVTNFRWNLSEAVLAPNGAGQADPAFASNINKWLPNFGTGIYVSNDRAYIGLSVPQLVENNYSTFDSGDQRAKQRRHFYMMGGFVLGKNAVKVKPSMLLKYVNKDTPLGLDLNTNVWFNDKFAIGASYRYNRFVWYDAKDPARNDAIVGMFEIQLTDQFRFGYSYDYTTNSLNSNGNFLSVPTHEAMIRYEFGSNKSKILTPRYF